MCKDNWTDSVLLSQGHTLASKCEEFIMLSQNATNQPVFAILHMEGSDLCRATEWAGHCFGGLQGSFPSSTPSCHQCWLLISHSCPLLRVGKFSK